MAGCPTTGPLSSGAYFTVGGLGAVAGPLTANGFMAATHSWRLYWWAMAAVMLALTLLALVFVKSPPVDAAAVGGGALERAHGHRRDWRFREAIRTSQYWVISLSMTATLLCVLTTSSFAPAHMTALGISTGVAATVAGAPMARWVRCHAIWAARSATRIDPKWLLVAGLFGEGIGMAALSVADNHVALGSSPCRKASVSGWYCWPRQCCWSTTSGPRRILKSTARSI